MIQVTAPSSFAWVQPVVLFEDAQSLRHAKVFLGTEPTVSASSSWVLQLNVNGDVQPGVLFGLSLNITNPSVWTLLDHELNY